MGVLSVPAGVAILEMALSTVLVIALSLRLCNYVQTMYVCFDADIDECAAGSDTCNSTVSFCRNVPGSFACDCLPGFIEIDGECVCEYRILSVHTVK